MLLYIALWGRGIARILPLYNLQFVKGDQKGGSEGSGKLLLCILSHKKTGHRGGGESNVSLNPKCLVLAIPF